MWARQLEPRGAGWYNLRNVDPRWVGGWSMRGPYRTMPWLVALLLVGGCVSGTKSGELPIDERPVVALDSWGPAEILPGTRFVLHGSNLGVIEQVRLVGTIAEREVDVSIAPVLRSDDAIELRFSDAVIAALGGARGRSMGTSTWSTATRCCSRRASSSHSAPT